MAKNSIRVVYDSSADVLYVSHRDEASSAASERDGAFSWRYRTNGDELVGVKLADFDAAWGGRFDAVPSDVAPRSRPARSSAAREA